MPPADDDMDYDLAKPIPTIQVCNTTCYHANNNTTHFTTLV